MGPYGRVTACAEAKRLLPVVHTLLQFHQVKGWLLDRIRDKASAGSDAINNAAMPIDPPWASF